MQIMEPYSNSDGGIFSVINAYVLKISYTHKLVERKNF